MFNKKCALALFILAISAALASSVFAYDPMVRLPGLPATGSISLSMYLVGLYNFLVSIVGIIAVMMMIIGGMRYISAAGSQTAIGDAKDMVSSAVTGLILAIFAWIIVAAINPDVLYIKSGGGASAITYYPFGKFTGPGTCVCTDTFNLIGTTSAEECNTKCNEQGHGKVKDISCIRGGINDLKDPKFALPDPNNGKCLCADLVDVSPAGGAITCDQVCGDTTKAGDGKYHCGFDYLFVKADVFPGAQYDKIPFIPDGTWENWEFFLTADGTYGGVNITATSLTVGPKTYECAIVITEEDTLSWDDTGVWWVEPGTIISSQIGSSLSKSIGTKTFGCCGLGGPACPILGSGCAATVSGDLLDIYYAEFSDTIVVDKCANNCKFAESNVQYRPAYDIICDPVIGKWVRYNGQ